MAGDERVDRRELVAIGSVLALFGVLAAATWLRWTLPFIDHGREMNLPLRLLHGEALYRDIVYQYGPLAPYLNALLYFLVKPHLLTLILSGLVCAVTLVIIVYRISRDVLGRAAAAAAASLVVVLCALTGPSGNLIQPYAFAALYGWTFAWLALFALLRFLEDGRRRSLTWVGIWCGAAVAAKPELAVQVAAPAAVAWVLRRFDRDPHGLPEVFAVTLPALAVIAAAYVPVLVTVPLHLFVADIYERFTQPQLVYFSGVLSGTLAWPASGWAVAAGVGDLLVVTAFVTLCGLMFGVGAIPVGRAVLALAAGALGLWLGGFRARAPELDHNLLRSATVVLPALVAALAVACYAGRIARRGRVLLLVSVFGLFAIARVPLNVSLFWAYTPFTVPALVIVYSALVAWAVPRLLLPTPSARRVATAAAVALMWLVVAGFAGLQIAAARSSRSFEVRFPRARFYTTPNLGEPLRDAVRFVRTRTAPGEFVLSIPQGTVVNFLADRPNPLREENIVPGFLTPPWERDAIQRVVDRRVRLILVANVLTPEYRDPAFGVDYNQDLFRWIRENYQEVATFGPADNVRLELGDSEFFIRAFERTWP